MLFPLFSRGSSVRPAFFPARCFPGDVFSRPRRLFFPGRVVCFFPRRLDFRAIFDYHGNSHVSVALIIHDFAGKRKTYPKIEEKRATAQKQPAYSTLHTCKSRIRRPSLCFSRTARTRISRRRPGSFLHRKVNNRRIKIKPGLPLPGSPLCSCACIARPPFRFPVFPGRLPPARP